MLQKNEDYFLTLNLTIKYGKKQGFFRIYIINKEMQKKEIHKTKIRFVNPRKRWTVIALLCQYNTSF